MKPTFKEIFKSFHIGESDVTYHVIEYCSDLDRDLPYIVSHKIQTITTTSYSHPTTCHTSLWNPKNGGWIPVYSLGDVSASWVNNDIEEGRPPIEFIRDHERCRAIAAMIILS